jgi:hypothetical protein
MTDMPDWVFWQLRLQAPWRKNLRAIRNKKCKVLPALLHEEFFMTLFEITVPRFIKGLRNFRACLLKGAHYAELKKFDGNVLTAARLAPDQFPLARQVQIACDTAKLCASRLTGKDAPVNDDQEKSIEELIQRIDHTVTYLETFSEKDFDSNTSSKRISQPRWEGKYLTGTEFVLEHAIPNFYFHVTTAYSILRHNGVDVGKKDYLGEMPFKRD